MHNIGKFKANFLSNYAYLSLQITSKLQLFMKLPPFILSLSPFALTFFPPPPPPLPPPTSLYPPFSLLCNTAVLLTIC